MQRLIEKIKQSKSLKNVPIIVVTSRSLEKYKSRALEKGASTLITKPFNEEVLLSVVKTAVNATRGAEIECILCIGFSSVIVSLNHVNARNPERG